MPPVKASAQVAIVNLHSYAPHGGVGRVVTSLMPHWQDLALSEATLSHIPVPLLRNIPVAIRAKPESQLVLFPQLTGALVLRRAQKLPSLVIVHDVGIVDFAADGAGRDRISEYLVKQSFRALECASHIVTVSDFSRNRLLAHLPKLSGRVTTIHNGVGEHFLRLDEPKSLAKKRLEARLKVRFSGPLLIYVGSEIKRKNLNLLLDVLVALKAEYPEAKLLKVGGPGQKCWRTLTLSQLATRHLVAGKDVVFDVPDDAQLASTYRAADVFVSASLYEGFGLPVLEAMAVGTPVVVTHRGAFPEVVAAERVRPVGRSVEPSVKPFLEAILAYLRRPVEGEYLRTHARRFTWAKSAEQYRELMLDLSSKS